MISTYIRSSSYTCWDFCQFKFFLDYVLGFRSPANKKAEIGTIVHKALEMLAKVKFAKQNGKDFIHDDEFGFFEHKEINADLFLQLAYNHYATKTQHMYDWKHIDFQTCKSYLNMALTYNKGMFNPMNQKIIEPEKYFDIVIDKPWAKYKFKTDDGRVIEGNLAIKGTLDLIIESGKNVYELIDYKTGQRKDINTGKEKTYESLHKDPQLLIYFYAMSTLFPDITQKIVTIFYIRDGGPFSMVFNKNHIKLAEKLLENRFNAIKNCKKPRTIHPSWKCEKLCYFGKNTIDKKKTSDYNESMCKTIHNDIVELGMDKVLKKYSQDTTYNSYGDGGGKSR